MYELVKSNWDDAEMDAMHRVIDSGRFTMGDEVAEFERQFAHHVGIKHAIMVNSGSSANLLMIGALVETGVLSPGDAVIVPAVGWSTTYFPLKQYGLKIILCDVHPGTLNLEASKVQACIFETKERVRAVMCVHLLGNPCSLTPLTNLCKERGIILLEDNCEGFGAKYREKHCGTFGLMGTFSSYFSHHLNTIEGGVVVTNDSTLARTVRSMRSHGWTRNEPDYVPSFENAFKFINTGYNVRPTEFQGALGQVQLSKAPAQINKRRENALIFLDMFKDHWAYWTQVEPSHSFSSWFGFAIIFRQMSMRARVIQTLNDMRIEVRPIVAGNIARHPVADKMRFIIPLPLMGADVIHDHGIFLGNDERSLRPVLQQAKSAIHGALAGEPVHA